MRNILLLIVSGVFLCFSAKAQTPFEVSFENVKDTIHSSSSVDYYTARITIPKQSQYVKPKILFSVDKERSNVKNISVPVDLVYEVDNTNDAVTEFKVFFKRDAKNDRTLAFKVTAIDDKGKEIKLADNKRTSAEVYIKPYGELESKDNEYWLFVGTNFDLLDGVKANDLFFRASFLVPISNHNPKRHQFYLTFEKNRFFSERDSLYRIPFGDIIFRPGQDDSITTVRGQYDSFRETVTENIGFSLNYLRNIKKHNHDNYNFYTMLGFYIDQQNRTSNYKNHRILSDTITSVRTSDTINFRPLLTRDRTQLWNSNFYLGFMYIHSGSSVNLKTYVQAGYYFLRHPVSRIRTSTTELTNYELRKDIYLRYRIDATLIESPGVSLGGEVYYRRGEAPLFNFTLTKVFDYRQIKNLFGKIPSQ